MWVTEGNKLSPNVGDLLADTGALSVASLATTILVSCDDDAAFVIHHRNALNTADLQAHRVAEFGYFFKLQVTFALVLNERITITADTVKGNIQASIMW